MRIRKIEDSEEAHELWTEFQCAAGLEDRWPGDEHVYWVLTEGATNLGMCSAIYRPERGYVYLSYTAIMPTCSQKGLQKKLIQHRLRWAKRQGAIYAVTYTLFDNFPSMVNLLKCGFRLSTTPRGWPGYGPNVHYFEKQL